jgi:hypothetical protein
MLAFFKELGFADRDTLMCWRPVTRRRLVVLDPTRNFGRPIVARRGMPAGDMTYRERHHSRRLVSSAKIKG